VECIRKSGRGLKLFDAPQVKQHINESSSVKSKAMVLTEWNLNIAENIEKIGNYRYRPFVTSDFAAKEIADSYDPLDAENDYTGATDSDVEIDGGYDENDNPILLTPADKKKELLFSLEQCFDRFRPRSGINKMIFNSGSYINDASTEFATRPRYYMASREDIFKYWTSIRNENGKLTGISIRQNGENYINDACPFVVYKNRIPVNRIVTKIQTNIGTTELGTDPNNRLYGIDKQPIDDPFYGAENMTVPKEWEIQYLDDSDLWQTAKSFTTNVFTSDGYLELQYGLIVPSEYAVFVKAPVVNSVEFIPENAPNGYSYLLIENTGDKGVYFTRNSSNIPGDTYDGNGTAYPGWDIWEPTYGWFVGNQAVDTKSPMVTGLTAPDSYIESGITKYREFSHIRGLRLKITTMNKNDSRLDLIELSPRLAADLSGVTRSYSISKQASESADSAFPVGGLVSSTGSLDLFDYDMAFSDKNENSILNVVSDGDIVYNISNKNMQIKFYEIIEDVEGKDFYIPIKTMYSEGFPEVTASERSTTINIKDLFFFFESTSPQDTIMIDQPVSYIVSTLLDSVGFSNYKFYRMENEKDDIIPFFFIAKEAKISQVLSELAIATQSAIFLDEYNDLVVASRGYMFPKTGDRTTAVYLKGSPDSQRNGAYKNQSTAVDSILANIKEISSQEEEIYNDGKVTYSPKYIQKTVSSISQASNLDKDRTWVYKPVLLWEVSQTDATKSVNGERQNSQGMALSAIPLGSTLTADIPRVVRQVNGVTVADNYPGTDDVKVMINNVINFGDSVYFVGRYNGYFYANGEIIRYDAVEYSAPQRAGTDEGPTVWVSSVEEYEELFSKIPFNGKLYPTGRVRIYAEARYDANDNLIVGETARHGRGQFGTPIVVHPHDLQDDNGHSWKRNIAGCEMDMQLLINGGNTVLSTAGRVSSASETKNAQGLYTATLTNLRSITGMHIGQEISATKVIGLADSGTIYGAVQVHSTKYTAKIKDLSSTSQFYVTQKIKADKNTEAALEGEFPVGAVISVDKILSKTEILVSSTAAFTNGEILDIRIDSASDEGGEIPTTAIITGTPQANGVNISSTEKMSNGSIVSIVTKELPAGGYNYCGKTVKAGEKLAEVSGLMKNYLSSNLSENPETDPSSMSKIVQSSALVINGPSFSTKYTPIDHITYSYRKMNNAYKHFGTRMRIIGQSGTSRDRLQTPIGSSGWTTIDGNTVSGSSGGMTVLLNPEKNVGYYFEIAAFTDNNVTNYAGESSSVNNVFFYKLRAPYDYLVSEDTFVANTYQINNGVITPVDADETFNIGGISNEAIGQSILFENQTDPQLNGTWRIDKLIDGWILTKIDPKAIPETLWAGLTSIITDNGQFPGSGRVLGEETPSVYDLGVEYVDQKSGDVVTKRTFNLYINHIKVAEIVDTDPAPAYDHMGLFSRGSARVMFENVYALTSNYSTNTESLITTPMNAAFGNQDTLSENAAFRKYALSGAIQATYLSSIDSESQPRYNIFYDEFGTIMREAAYFNIRYEDAYPALRAKVAPTTNTEKGYTISGFMDTPYGAEFLIFNNTDTILAIDETTGNYLRILGVTFTQESSHDLKVDDYFNQVGNLSNVEEIGTVNLSQGKKRFQDIKNSRSVYGVKEFSLESPYIQSRDTAERIMDWTLDRLAKPRKAIGLSIFANPLIQLGDIIEIDYKDASGMDVLGTTGSQFVVYSIDYQKAAEGPSMTLHVSEVC